jgi:hypothetical protein
MVGAAGASDGATATAEMTEGSDSLERFFDQHSEKLSRLGDEGESGAAQAPGTVPEAATGQPEQQATTYTAGAEGQAHSPSHPAEVDIDQIVDQVLIRVRRQLMLEHERSGGFPSHFMR